MADKTYNLIFCLFKLVNITLVTAGTIKRPLPCPVKGIEKQRDRKIEDFSQRKRENRVRGKEKRLERKQREKKTKKERRELV